MYKRLSTFLEQNKILYGVSHHTRLNLCVQVQWMVTLMIWTVVML